MTHDGHEFSAEHGQTIGKTGARARWWGVLLITFGALLGVASVLTVIDGGRVGVPELVIYGVLTLLPMYIGINFVRAGRSLGSVATSEGSDVAHLVGAMGSLGTALLVQLLASSIWVVGLGVGLVALMASANFADTRAGAYQAAQRSDLRALGSAQSIYFSESVAQGGTYRFASRISDLDIYLSDGVHAEILYGGVEGWSARSGHAATDQECVIYFGGAPIPSTTRGATPDAPLTPSCDPL